MIYFFEDLLEKMMRAVLNDSLGEGMSFGFVGQLLDYCLNDDCRETSKCNRSIGEK